jgi:hypothetical protein
MGLESVVGCCRRLTLFLTEPAEEWFVREQSTIELIHDLRRARTDLSAILQYKCVTHSSSTCILRYQRRSVASGTYLTAAGILTYASALMNTDFYDASSTRLCHETHHSYIWDSLSCALWLTHVSNYFVSDIVDAMRTSL